MVQAGDASRARLWQNAAMGQIDDGYVLHVSELLAPWAAVDARRMFGGWGLYRGALMFALIAADTLYFKRGAHLNDVAQGRVLTNFSYERTVPAKTSKGKPTKKKHELAYAQVPADVIEDSDLFCSWAQAAWDDAIASRRLLSATKPHLALSRAKAVRRSS